MIKSLESSKALVYLVLLLIFPLRLQAVDSLEGQRSAPEHPQRRSASLADKERGTPDLQRSRCSVIVISHLFWGDYHNII